MTARVTRDDVFALLAVARLGAAAVSAEGYFVFWNHAAERILGLPAAQVIGRKWDEIVVSVMYHEPAPDPSSDGVDCIYAVHDPRPVAATVLCGSLGHKQVALTPVVIADEPGGDGLILYLFESASESEPPHPDARGVLEPSVEPIPAPAAHPANSPGPHSLTRREIEVLRLVARGTGTDQIASGLGISIHTVRNHIRSLRGKLDAKTKLEAVITAMRHGLL